MSQKLSPNTRERVTEMNRSLMVPFDVKDFVHEVHLVSSRVESIYVSPLEAFIKSLASLVHTASVPFVLASASAHDNHYQRVSIAARIRAEMSDQEPTESSEQFERRKEITASQKASAEMQAFASSDEGIDHLAGAIADMLLSGLKNESLASAAQELLLQGAVGTWSALEVLIKDELEILLNHNTSLVTHLLSDVAAKKRFEPPRLTIDDLESVNYNLSDRMGAVLFSDRDFSDLKAIKAACFALFPDSERLRTKLDDPLLWQLNQERHLIVHRRGIIDTTFIKNTGSTLAVGSRLTVDPDRLNNYLRLVKDIGVEFANTLTQQSKAR